MISGASDEELILAEARADIMLALDNTSTYESWLIIDTYIEKLEDENERLKKDWNEYGVRINSALDVLYTYGEILKPKFQQEMLKKLKGEKENESEEC